MLATDSLYFHFKEIDGNYKQQVMVIKGCVHCLSLTCDVCVFRVAYGFVTHNAQYLEVYHAILSTRILAILSSL
jgi:hypothetical protein